MILAGQATTASSLRLHSLAKLESHDEMVHKIWDNVCMYIMIRVNVTVNSNGKLNLFVFMIPSQAGAIPRFGHTGAGVGAGGGWLREGGPAPPARLLATRKPRFEGSGTRAREPDSGHQIVAKPVVAT